MAQQPLQPDPRNVFKINLAPHANQSLHFTFQPASDGPVRIEISTGPPRYIRPSFPVHRGTSPVPMVELVPDDLKAFFDSDEEVEVVDTLPACLSMTAQPADDPIVSETEPESDEDVTIVHFQPVAGPSRRSTVLPSKDLSLTKPKSNKEDIMTKPTTWTNHVAAGQKAGVKRFRVD